MTSTSTAFRVLSAAGLLTFGAAAAQAAPVTPDVIFGSGNANGGYTVATGSYAPFVITQVDTISSASKNVTPSFDANLEIGLRAKLRFDEFNQPRNIFNQSGSTYTFDAGAAPGGFGFDANSPTTPVWNFEWSVTTDLDRDMPIPGVTSLSALTYELRIDGDSGIGVNFAKFDPIRIAQADHALGNLLTGNGEGVVSRSAAEYQANLAKYSVAQNSWNYEFFNEPTDGAFLSELAAFDPSEDGTYRIEFEAFFDGKSVASTGIDVVVGNGASPTPSPVPVPAALPLLVAALGGLGAIRRRKRA